MYLKQEGLSQREIEAYTTIGRVGEKWSGRLSPKISVCSTMLVALQSSSRSLSDGLSMHLSKWVSKSHFQLYQPLRVPKQAISRRSPSSSCEPLLCHLPTGLPENTSGEKWPLLLNFLPDLTLGSHTGRLKSRTNEEGDSGKCDAEEIREGTATIWVWLQTVPHSAFYNRRWHNNPLTGGHRHMWNRTLQQKN